MKVLLVLHLLFPGESSFETIAEYPVASFQECRMAARLLRAQQKAPEGFQYVTSCYDADTSATPALGDLRLGIDQDFERVPRKKE
jgi:hypothetical protein